MADSFFILWLGHLFGDYVLQNGYIAKRKERNLGVLLIHVMLVGASHLLFFLPSFNGNILAAVGFVVAAHFLIDYSKFRLSKVQWVSTPWYYLFDQGLHISTLLIVAPLIAYQQAFFNGRLSLMICAAILNAYAWGIFAHLGWGEKSNGYRRDWVGYLFRGASAVLHNWYWLGSLAVLLLGWFLEERLTGGKKRAEISVSFALSFASNIFLINILGKNFWG
ncbi:MAG: DUF3307 domain-containing protein [Thermotogae bacterium]|nr:DUF3307 domain-containing protein [Thermotogota bacterium]